MSFIDRVRRNKNGKPTRLMIGLNIVGQISVYGNEIGMISNKETQESPTKY